MLSMLKVLVLAACVAFVVGDGHAVAPDCESDEAAACSVCACLLTGGCTEEQTTFCTDPVEAAACKYTRTPLRTRTRFQCAPGSLTARLSLFYVMIHETIFYLQFISSSFAFSHRRSLAFSLTLCVRCTPTPLPHTHT